MLISHTPVVQLALVSYSELTELGQNHLAPKRPLSAWDSCDSMILLKCMCARQEKMSGKNLPNSRFADNMSGSGW